MNHAIEARRFTDLQAQFVKLGHRLYKSGLGESPSPFGYFTERWGMVRHLPSIDDADRFPIQIKVGHHGPL